MNDENFLIENILDFIEVLYKCYSCTSFLNDRSVYKEDIVLAIGWIIELRTGSDVEIIIKKINSKSINKYFSDYWRQGNFGDRVSSSFFKLKNNIKS